MQCTPLWSPLSLAIGDYISGGVNSLNTTVRTMLGEANDALQRSTSRVTRILWSDSAYALHAKKTAMV